MYGYIDVCVYIWKEIQQNVYTDFSLSVSYKDSFFFFIHSCIFQIF